MASPTTLLDAVNNNLGPADYQVPAPELSLLQRLLFRDPDRYVSNTKQLLSSTALAMGRHPTQDEVNALCEITYKEARTAAWTMPLSIGLAVILSLRGRATYRFALYQPKFTKFNPDVFPSTSSPYLQGRLANRMWHNLRFASYFALSTLGIGPFIASYATSVAVATTARDPRLKNFRQDINPERIIRMTAGQLPPNILARERQKTIAAIKRIETGLSRLPTEDEVRQKAPPGQVEEAVQQLRDTTARAQRDLEQLHRALAHIVEVTTERNSASEDYNSTSSQNRDYEALSGSAADSAGGHSLPTDTNSTFSPSYSRDTPTSETRPGWGWGQQSASSQQNSSKAVDDLDFDDASPVAPTTRSTQQSSASSNSMGSSWERLRQASRQATAASGSGAWSRSQGQQDQSNDYTYDRDEAERVLAKEKAQKEFDEMLERERKAESDQASGRRSSW
ncbi:hypothetical protein CCHL11_06294 [Colletotrichum chlorophyti]|uniref:Uncharacterized protein n=1 Tax=Colletotrichum chlorophyti TaxID=708187 RepID=A0A1Q8RL79_9PEZI|nr:hypothetical protein CCHL11_06294 [Colletotrichum chlorophyti]